MARRLRRLATGALLAAVVALVASGAALALFSAAASVAANQLTTDTLDPPTGLSATGGSSITLQWTPTTDAYATGYRVLRAAASGGPYVEVAQVTPQTTSSYSETPSPGTYYYVLETYHESWTSSRTSEVSAIQS